MKIILNLLIFIPLLNAMVCDSKVKQDAQTQVQDSVAVLPVEIRPDVDSALVEGNNQFALELFSRLDKSSTNVFISPFSISTAMAMVYAGSAGKTETEIDAVMHFGKRDDEFNLKYASYLAFLDNLGNADSLQLSTGNALFAQKEYNFLPKYFSMMKDYFRANAQNLDFKNETERSRKIINEWVAGQTNQMIKELIPEDVLTGLTRLVLVNAIYFNGSWERPFDKAKNKNLSFYKADGTAVMADFMTEDNTYNYYEAETFSMLELPYAGKQASMLIILPHEGKDMASVEKSLTNKSLSTWNRKMKSRKVKIYIPKFKTTYQIELSAIFKQMGMVDAFSRSADFSGMTGIKDLMIDIILHKAVVDVSEKGTEAAGATAVVMIEKSGMVDPIPVFKADKPFLFIIKENTHQSILFAGKINDPTK